ncbi:hypothetical protein [Streptomyces sp. NPDC014894]|uniref:hypothetical protein n=1 Tax=Streptomyces sp. NPDC014894 TaxID=3364931 RepID=UPI0036F5C294
MRFTELQALLDRHTAGDTLTLAAADLGSGPAAALVGVWFEDRTFTVRAVSREDRPESSTVVLGGEVAVLGLTGAPVTGVEFGLDPVDREPTLFVPLATPAGWTLADSFPDTGGSDLAGLAFGDRRPELLLTSVPRPARDGRPVLGAGLTLHAPEVRDPAPLGPLADLVRAPGGLLSLTGQVLRRPVGARVVTDIALSSVPEPSAEFGGDFALWAGSGGDGPALAYGLRLVADLVPGAGVGVTLSAPLPVTGDEIVLTADVLPGGDVDLSVLEGWYGTGAAVRQLTAQGFALGDAVRLADVSAFVDVTAVARGPAEALAAITAEAVARPEVSWPVVGDDLAVTGVGARLTVTAPLRPSRSAAVTGHGDFTFAGAIALRASAEIPPGDFELTLDEGKQARLVDVLRHFLPGADLGGAPDLTLRKFRGTAAPTRGEYTLSAAVATEWHIGVGASVLRLDEATLELAREAERAEFREGTATTPAAHLPDAGAKTAGTLAAKAGLGPADGGGGVLFDAAWHLPGAFELGGALPEVDLTALLEALACRVDVPLPDGLPEVELRDTTVRLRLGGARAGDADEGGGYELAVGGTVDFAGTKALTLVGKAAEGDSGTLFAAAFWQDGWTWSPDQVPGWSEALGLLGGITFAKSGLAVCSADGVALASDSAPDTLPDALDKGLTFFTEIGFTGPLEPLGALLGGDAGGVRLEAVLASPVLDSVFRASVAESGLRHGFGGLEVEIQPARLRITLATSWNFTVPAMGTAPETPLRFDAGGTVSEEGLSLFLTLRPADSALGADAVAGRLDPGRSAFALDRRGRTILPAAAVRGPDGRLGHTRPGVAGRTGHGTPGVAGRTGHEAAGVAGRTGDGGRTGYGGDARTGYAAARRAPEGDPPPGPAWKNAFGIEGFDIEALWAQIGGGTSGLTLGMGGTIRVGPAGLELDVVGGLEPEPFVTVFRFSLTTADRDKGVSLWDVLAIVVAPPEALAFLKKIVLHELMFCAVTAPGGWTSPLGEHWDQGCRGKGNIDFFGDEWRFEVGVGNDGVYADSAIARPVTIGEWFTLSDKDGVKGPRYLLDTRGIKEHRLPETILSLSGRIALLGASAAVEARLGADGFEFALETDLLTILESRISCVLDTDSGLHASADVGLDFGVELPRGALLGGIPIAGGTLVGVKAGGGFDLRIDGDTARLRLTADCDAYLAGVHLVGFALDLTFDVRTWDDIVGYLQDNPEKLFESLGQGVWDAMKGCATSRAAELT